MHSKPRYVLFGLLIALMGMMCFGFPSVGQEDSSPHISSIAWSPDGKMIAVGVTIEVGCDDPSLYAVHLIDTNSGNVLTQLQGEFCAVNAVSFSPDGTRLIMGSRGGVTYIWSLNTYQPERADLTFTSILKVAWNANGTSILKVYDHGVRIYDRLGLSPVASFSRFSESSEIESITNATWSPDSQSIAFSSVDSNIYLWEPSTKNVSVAFSGHDSPVTSVAWNPKGSTVASGDSTGTILVWNVESGQVVSRLLGDTVEIKGLTWNPDGETLASASLDGSVRVWDVSSQTVLETFNGLEQAWAVSYSPYGGQLAFGGRVISASETNNNFVNDAVERVVPAPSLDRLNAIAELCVRDAATQSRAVTGLTSQRVTSLNALPDFVAQVESLPEGAIPPACRADLLAVAGALR